MKKLTILLLMLGYVFSMQAQVINPAVDSLRAANPTEVIGKSFKTTGTISMSVGVPCLAAGIGCLMYANLMKDPTAGLTTNQAVANHYADRTYVTTEEYVAKLTDYYSKKNAASTAGYILAPTGAALTVVGVPLYLYGKKIMQLDVNYTGNGAGVRVTF